MASREQRLAIVVVAKDLASKTLRGINGELARMAGGRSPLAQVAGGFGTLGAGVARVGVIAGAAAIGGLAAASRAGIDFQDAFAGVRKTVEGTPEELDALYQELRQLAQRIPIKFVDLATIAQEAGALGVPTKNIAEFTEAVGRVTAATVGFDAQTASEAFGKLGALFSLEGVDYERLGSVLVDLGNKFPSLEVEIIEVARRFGGVGRAAGLSVPQILAWSTALAGLGPLAEAAGSSLARVFGRVIQYAATGDKKFGAFAASAGMTEEAFKALVKVDPSGAMAAFVGGLAKLDKFELAATLKKAGITNVRDIQAIQALAQNTDMLSDALGVSDNAWKTNTALVDVSDKRFNTLRGHLATFRNSILDAAVTVSEGMNPAIGRAVERLRELLLLPTSQADLRNLGKDIGEAIDKINWQSVIDGAKTLVGIIKTAVDIIRQIPPEITAGIIGFGAINRISGGLIGQGIGDIMGGAARAGISQIFGRGSPANPMWVRVVGGGLGAGGGAGPAAGGGLGRLASAVSVVSIVGSALAVFGVWQDQNNRSTEQGNAIALRMEEWLKEGPTKGEIETGLRGVQQGIKDLESQPFLSIVQGEALDKLRAMEARLQSVLGKLDTINYSITHMPAYFGSARDQGRGSGPEGRPPVYRSADLPGPGRARGGPVWAGGSYTVGERGPEHLTMYRGGGGLVTPMAGGGFPAITLNIRMPAPRFSAREGDMADRQWRRVTSANGSPVSIY